MKISNKPYGWMLDIAKVAHGELRNIARNYATVLVLVGGIFAYGLLYNYMYEPDVIRDAPVAVVDQSHSPLSREYTRLLNAAQQVKVISSAPDFPQAKELVKTNKAVGIIYIPDDFETRVNRGDESVFLTYGITYNFLYYLALQESSAGAMMALNDRYRPEMAVFLPQQDVQQIAQTQPITVVGTALYNHTEGYGSYLIPAVLMVIIFQTLMMITGMISGNGRHTGSIGKFAKEGTTFGRMARVVIGKTVVYCVLYGIFSLFLLGLMPVVFNLPNIGGGMEIVMLMIPFLMATSFFGLAGSVFYTDSETPLLMIAFFSVGLIFLSGISYPLELMPWYWRAAHFIFPAAPGTLAFVKINSMGASMADIRTEYIALWVQTVVYFVLASLAYRRNIRLYLKTR